VVCDHGKPYWLEMDWVVRSVDGKNPERPNKWHPKLIGKRCGIEIFQLRRTGHIWIEGLVDWEEYSPFYTSPVLSMEFLNDVLTVETENSVYTLEKKYGEESND
jgi:hypothetical protein